LGELATVNAIGKNLTKLKQNHFKLPALNVDKPSSLPADKVSDIRAMIKFVLPADKAYM